MTASSAAANHVHAWEPQPEFSGRAVTRYLCACGAWGFRVWPRRRGAKVPAILLYANGFDAEAYRARAQGSQSRPSRAFDPEALDR